MYTLHDLITEALTEQDAIPGTATLTDLDTDTDLADPGHISVGASWFTGTARTTLDDGGPGPDEDTWGEHDDTANWDGTTHPAEVINDLVAGIDPDVLDGADITVGIGMPARAWSWVLRTYLDGPELTVGWDPHLSRTGWATNRIWSAWNRAMKDLTSVRNNLRPSVTGRNEVYREGLLNGVRLTRALDLAHDLDDQLRARGDEPAFVELTMPQLVGPTDLRTGDWLTRWRAARSRAAAIANITPPTAEAAA